MCLVKYGDGCVCEQVSSLKEGYEILFYQDENRCFIVFRTEDGRAIHRCSCGAERAAVCKCASDAVVGNMEKSPSLEGWNEATRLVGALFGRTISGNPVVKNPCMDPFSQMAQTIGALFGLEIQPVMSSAPGCISFRFVTRK